MQNASSRLRAQSLAARIDQSQADAGFGRDVAGIGGVIAELGAQLGDQDPQVVRVGRVGRAPELAQQLRLGQDPATVPEQQREQSPLFPGEGDRLAFPKH